MSRDLVVNAFGARWRLGLDGLDAPSAQRLRVLWERCRVEDDGGEEQGVHPFPLTTSDPYAVSRALTLASLRRRRGEAILLHAVGLERDGTAIALVGPSGAGKSTAALTLGRHLGYLSDETIAVEDDNRVAPYPKPVSVVTDPEQRWVKAEWSPDELGLRVASDAAYLRAVVVLERDAAHEIARLDALPLADALLAVCAQSSSLPMVPRPLHRLAGLLDAAGGPHVLRYREISDCAELVERVLDSAVAQGDALPSPSWSSTPGSSLEHDPARGEVVRAPWLDAIHTGDGSVLLVGEDLVRLGPVGQVLWHAAASPVAATQLTDVVVEALGEHPDAEAIVAEGVEQLIESGALHARR